LTQVFPVFAVSQKLLRALTRRPRRALAWLVVLAVATVAIYAGVTVYRTRYQEPRSHFQAAQQALENRDFAEARQHLAVCQAAWPEDAATHFLAAQAARRAWDLDDAEAQLALCQRLQEKQPDPSCDTALEWALLQAQRGKLVEVEDYLRTRLREERTNSLLILEVLTWELMGSYRLREALQYLNFWLDRQPDDYEALVRRGWVAEHLFDKPAAVRDYRKALAQKPKQDSVRLRVAELLLAQNRPGDALDDLLDLHDRLPDNPSVTVALAHCRRLLSQFPDAAELLDHVLKAQPGNAQALSERGLLALEMGQPDQAERMLRQAADSDPSDRQLNYNLFQCLTRLGKKEEARKCQERIAQAKADMQRMGELMQQVMRKPHNPALRYEVGMIFLRNKFTEDGERWLLMALQDDPHYRPARQALFDHYERIGNSQEAARHRRWLQQEEPPPP
jgi:predicted Zn-dependent protease